MWWNRYCAGSWLMSIYVMLSIFPRKLRCPRNTLHMHLFLSFMCRAFMALLKDSLFIEGIGLSQTIVDGMTLSEVSVHNLLNK